MRAFLYIDGVIYPEGILWIIGFASIIVGFIWMILSQSSTGPFLILGGAGGALIADEIRKSK